VLQTRLTIQDELLSSSVSGELRFPQEYGDVAQLLKACNRTAKEQFIQEWTFADETNWRIGQGFYGWMTDQLEKAMQSDGCLLRLGWGAGFDDKTMTDLLDDDTFREVLDTYGLTVGRPGRRRSNPPMDKRFAPKSRNVALNRKKQWLPLGWVRLEITERRR
jgi:CRISPR type III-A-associated RAMP protein Csm5